VPLVRFDDRRHSGGHSLSRLVGAVLFADGAPLNPCAFRLEQDSQHTHRFVADVVPRSADADAKSGLVVKFRLVGLGIHGGRAGVHARLAGLGFHVAALGGGAGRSRRRLRPQQQPQPLHDRRIGRRLGLFALIGLERLHELRQKPVDYSAVAHKVLYRGVAEWIRLVRGQQHFRKLRIAVVCLHPLVREVYTGRPGISPGSADFFVCLEVGFQTGLDLGVALLKAVAFAVRQ